MIIKKKKIPDYVKYGILEYLFAFTLILECNSMWSYYANIGTLIKTMSYLMLGAICILYWIVIGRVKSTILTKVVVLGVATLVYCVIYYTFTNYNNARVFSLALGFCCLYFFLKMAIEKNRVRSILCAYQNMILVISVVSLFFWLFGSVLGLLQPTGTIASEWTGGGSAANVSTYFHVFFEPQTTRYQTRNTGIFTEAPMYSFHLSLAFLLELFQNEKKPSVPKCVLLIVTILTTVSSTGYIIVIIALFFKFICEKNMKKGWQILRVAIIPIILIGVILVLQYLLSDKLDSESGRIRIDDISAGFKAWMENILLGVGYGNDEGLRKYMASWRTNLGFSNSILLILAYGGLLLAIPYIALITMWLVKIIKKKDRVQLSFFICFFFMFAITIVPTKLLTLFIFMVYAIGMDNSKQQTTPSLNKSPL